MQMPPQAQRSCRDASPHRKRRWSRRSGRSDRRWFGRSPSHGQNYVVRPPSSLPRQESSRSMQRRCLSDACSSCNGKRRRDLARRSRSHEADHNCIPPAIPSLASPRTTSIDRQRVIPPAFRFPMVNWERPSARMIRCNSALRHLLFLERSLGYTPHGMQFLPLGKNSRHRTKIL